jgi:hypothetical protein
MLIDTGIADQNIEWTSLDAETRDGRMVGQIEGRDLTAALRGKRGRSLGITVADQDRNALGDQASRDSSTDPLRPAGDDGAAATQSIPDSEVAHGVSGQRNSACGVRSLP